MGLDTCHFKLVTTPVDPEDVLYVEEWEDGLVNVALEHYERFITDVPYTRYDDRSIIIVKSEQDAEKMNGWLKSEAIQYYVSNDVASLEPEIARFIARHELDKLERSDLEMGMNDVMHYSISFLEHTTKKGVFYKEVGYQRKGMCNAFYEYFSGHGIAYWGKRADFDYAYACVGADSWYIRHWGQEAVERTRADFRRDFVDKFVFGESLLWPSF